MNTQSQPTHRARSTQHIQGDAMKPRLLSTARLSLAFATALAAMMAATSATHAASGTWLGNANWWTDPASWVGGITPSGTDGTAYFTGVDITGDINKPLGSTSPAQNRTIGHIIFTDTAPSHNLTLSANILTLDVTSGQPNIDVTQSGRTLTISSQISGSDGLQKLGLGNLLLSGNNNYTGITTVNNGTLTLGNANALGATGAGNGTVINGSNAVAFFGTILNLGATGLTLSESFSLNGNTTGRATIFNNSAAAHVLNGNIDVTSDTSHAQIRSNAATNASITVNGDISGTLTNGAALFIRGDSTSTTNRILGSINIGSAALSKNDAGTWTIGATGKTYAWGDTLIPQGTLRMGFANVLPSSTIVSLGQDDANSATLDLNGFSQTVAGIQLSATPGTGSRTITSSTAATLTVGSASDFTYGGVLTGSLALTKTGTGTLTLTGNNTHTGATNINDGTLKLQGGAFSTTARTYSISSGAVLNLDGGASIASGTGASSTTINGAGTLRITGGTLSAGADNRDLNMNLGVGSTIDIQAGAIIYNGGWANIFWANNSASLNLDGSFNIVDGNNVQVDALTGTGTFTQSGNNTKTLTVGYANGSGVFSGVIQNPSGTTSLTKVGTGTQTLDGNNTYTGATNVSGGTLKITGSGRLYSAAYNGSAVVTVQSGGVLELDTWSYGASESLGRLAKEAARIVINNGTIRMNGTTEYGRGVTVLAGGATFEAAAGANWTHDGSDFTANVYTGNPSLTFTGDGTGTFAKEFSGSGSLTKSGAGTWTLSVANSYTGGTFIDGGVLQAGHAQALGTSGAIDFGGGTLQYTAASVGQDWGSRIQNSTSAISLDTNGQTVSLGAMDSSNTGGLTKLGAGTLALTGANSYSGGTTISGGTLTLGHTTNTLDNGGAVNVNGGTLALGTNNDTVGAVTLTSGSITGTSGVLTGSSYAVESGTISAILGGAGALTKSTGGTVTLTGVNTYSGITTVTEGTLAVNGSLANTSAVTVEGGGILQGSGSITGPVTIQNGGRLASGNSIESLESGTLTLSSGSFFDYEMDGSADPYEAGDLTAVTGDLIIDSGAILTIDDLGGGGGWAFGDKLTVISYTGTWNSSDLFTYLGSILLDDTILLAEGNRWLFNYNDDAPGSNYTLDLTEGAYVTMTYIPEPSTAILAALGLAGLCVRRRRK